MFAQQEYQEKKTILIGTKTPEIKRIITSIINEEDSILRFFTILGVKIFCITLVITKICSYLSFIYDYFQSKNIKTNTMQNNNNCSLFLTIVFQLFSINWITIAIDVLFTLSIILCILYKKRYYITYIASRIYLFLIVCIPYNCVDIMYFCENTEKDLHSLFLSIITGYVLIFYVSLPELLIPSIDKFYDIENFYMECNIYKKEDKYGFQILPKLFNENTDILWASSNGEVTINNEVVFEDATDFSYVISIFNDIQKMFTNDPYYEQGIFIYIISLIPEILKQSIVYNKSIQNLQEFNQYLLIDNRQKLNGIINKHFEIQPRYKAI